jgi:Protein of unknown function (DUF1439)
MSKRAFVGTVFAFLALVAAAGVFCALFGINRISLTESDIQTPLNQQLPKTVERLTIERVEVRLADDRLGLRIDLQGAALNQQISSSVSVRGSPRYDARTGELFFDADDVDFVRLAVGNKTVVGETAPAAGSEIASPAVQQFVEIAIKLYLARQPVYRFKNDLTGTVAKMALAGVAVEQNNLVAYLSIWSLTAAVAIFGLIVLVALYLAYLFIRYPPWRQTMSGV